MSLDKNNFRPLTSILLRGMFDHSKPDAPWLAGGDALRDFLQEGIDAGLAWRVDEKMLRQYLTPAAQDTFCVKARGRLAEVGEFERGAVDHRIREVFAQSLYGVAHIEAHYVGNWQRPDSDDPWEKEQAVKQGDEDRYYSSKNPIAPPLDTAIPLLNHFWSDIPAYLVGKVSAHLVQREEFNQNGWGSHSTYMLDVMDAGRCFHALEGANRLTPHTGPNLANVFSCPSRESLHNPTSPSARKRKSP